MKIRIGVQMYTLRFQIKSPEAMEEAFRRSRGMGAACVQAINAKGVTPALLRDLSEKYALPICTVHANFGRLQNDIDRLAEEYLAFGCDTVGVGMMPLQYQRKGLDGTAAFVELLNEAVGKLRQYNLKLTYHNHAFEFKPVDGGTLYDYILANTEPDILFTPDVYWIKAGGHEPEAILEKLAGRTKVMHLKDYEKKRRAHMREIGAGTLDFPSILRQAEQAGVTDAVIELDWARRPYQSLESSLRYLDGIYGLV